MALLTPPSSSHRSDKENKFAFSLTVSVDSTLLSSSLSAASDSTSKSEEDSELDSASGRNVVWSPHNSYHSLTTPPKPRPSAAVATALFKDRPVKSILKRRPLKDATNKNASLGMLEMPEDLDATFKQREVTPEPADPLVDLKYLGYPVSLILKKDARLRELIEGYSILGARLRACVGFGTDADASWPLFQPLRKNREEFVDAVVRDLGRALVDPTKTMACPKDEVADDGAEWEETEEKETLKSGLPSPKQSPIKPKKKGMSAEQVKYARDLCTTCHSVIKLLCAVFCFPAVYGVFQDKQLKQMLTAVLAIPMAEDLPTPNARKTCALAVMLLQSQRLPEEVLLPTRDRIAHALRRGIDGELGKEGKKGSANDGLKAIHDLSVYRPSIFVPVFAKPTLLPSILSNLLAPTLALRIQACHALGGLAHSLSSLPHSSIHATASNIVADFLTPVLITSPTKLKSASSILSPTTATAAVKEALIIRTLRTTISAQEPTHIAQSPVWAISVIASLIVLLGSRIYTDKKICLLLMGVFKLGYKHKKSAVRSLFCAAWRAVIWAWFQPEMSEESDDGEEGKYGSEHDEKREDAKKKSKEVYFQLMHEVLDLQAGVSTIAALLSCPSADEDDSLRRALSILQSMANSTNSDTISDSATVLSQLLTGRETGSNAAPSLSENANALLPKALFSSPPVNGLLGADFSKTLTAAVRLLFDQVPTLEDVRALKREELSKVWVWEGLIAAWRTIIGTLEMFDDAEMPDDLTAVWESLLTANVGALQDAGEDIAPFALRVSNVLAGILTDPLLDFSHKPSLSTTAAENNKVFSLLSSDDAVPEPTGSMVCTKAELKLKVVKTLWTTVKTIFPHDQLSGAAENLLKCLMDNVGEMTVPRRKKRANSHGNAIAPAMAWTAACVNVMTLGDADCVKIFWGYDRGGEVKQGAWSWDEEMRSAAWKTCVTGWKKYEGQWEGAVLLLAVPFTELNGWSLSNEETSQWNELLEHATNKALDYGVDSTTVLDSIAAFISSHTSFPPPPRSSSTCIQAADLLLGNLDIAEARELPAALIELIDETMRTCYPPEPRNIAIATWLIQSLTKAIENCPKMLVENLVEGVGEGVALWLADECEVWTEDVLDYNFLPLYQHLLLRLQSLPTDITFLESISPLLDSVFSGRTIPEPVMKGLKETFDEFWRVSYGKVEVPRQGWPARIRHCLGIEEEHEPAVTLTPRKTDRGKADPTSVPRTPMAPINLPSVHRPHKPPVDSFVPFPVPPRSPLSPVRRRTTSSSSARFPTTPTSSSFGLRSSLGESPSKRRRITEADGEEKENASPFSTPCRSRILVAPIFNITPVTERIAASMKTKSPKKRLFDEDENHQEKKGVRHQQEEKKPIPKKKLKLREKMMGKTSNKMWTPTKMQEWANSTESSSPARSVRSNQGSNDSEDERWVEHALVPFPTMGYVANVGEASVEGDRSPKKRRRMVIDSVLVPTVEQVARKRRLEHSASFESFNSNDIPTALETPVAALKRTMSGSQLMALARKRKRSSETLTDNCSADPFIDESFSSSPLPALRIPSYGLHPMSTASSSTIGSTSNSNDITSSDDDPYIGQVTPHHLISPPLAVRDSKVYSAIMRAPEVIGDVSFEMPGSDDSLPDSSPSKGFIRRRLQRTCSLKALVQQ